MLIEILLWKWLSLISEVMVHLSEQYKNYQTSEFLHSQQIVYM